MRSYLIYLVVLFFYCSINKSQAQDTVCLISGKIIQGKVQDKDLKNEDYFFVDIKKKNKIKKKLIETEDVFSVSYLNGKNEILYRTDSTKGLILDQPQMFNYMIGEQVAFNKHRTSSLIIAGGAASGIAGGFLGLYGLLLPAAYATGISFVEPKVQFDETNMPSRDYKEYYDMGYKSVARSRNVKNVIISGFSGIILTGAIITAFQISSIGLTK
jgi:hypothetical protein